MSALDKALKETLLESYPAGLRTAPLISLPFQGKIVKAYELKTEDAIYLIINDMRIDDSDAEDQDDEDEDDDEDFEEAGDDAEGQDDSWDGDS